MERLAFFILLLLSIFTANQLEVSGISVKQRVSIIEHKVGSLEILTSTFQDSFTEITNSLEDVNTTMLAMCAVNGRGEHVTSPKRQHMRTKSNYDSHELNARLVQAFKDEKEYVRKQEQIISDKTDAFLKTVMEKIANHEQRVADIFNDNLNKFNEKVTETSLLTDGMEQRLNKVNADIEELFSSTAALKSEIQSHVTKLTDQVEKQLKSAEDQIVALTQKSDAVKTDVNSHDEKILSLLTNVANNQKQIELALVSGWRSYNNFFYSFFDSDVTFAMAKETCASFNAYVVDVDTQAENDFVFSLITSSSKQIWLGLTDSAAEGTWRWERTGAVATYLNWRPGQPDSLGGNQDCVFAGLRQPYEQWNDNWCSQSYRFVCKRSLV